MSTVNYFKPLTIYIFCLLFAACSNEGKVSEIFFETVPEVIPVNNYFSLIIQLGSEKYKHVKPSDIHVEAIMPSHGHGMNVEPIIIATDEPGRYLAKGLLFHMRGDWEVIVHVNLGKTSDRITFSSTI